MCLPFSNGKIWDICFPVFRIWKQKTRTVLLRSGLYLEKWSTLMSEIFNLSDLRYFICHLSEREEHWTLCTKRQTLDEPKPESWVEQGFVEWEWSYKLKICMTLSKFQKQLWPPKSSKICLIFFLLLANIGKKAKSIWQEIWI